MTSRHTVVKVQSTVESRRHSLNCVNCKESWWYIDYLYHGYFLSPMEDQSNIMITAIEAHEALEHHQNTY